MRKTRLFFSSTLLLLFSALPTTSVATEAPELTYEEGVHFGILVTQGKHLEAVDFLEKRIGQAEPTVQQLSYLCGSIRAGGLYGKMTACFEKLELKASSGKTLMPWDYNNMSKGYSDLGNHTKAIWAAKKAVEIVHPKNTFHVVLALGNLGSVQAASGDKEGARETAKELAAVKMRKAGNSFINEEMPRLVALKLIYRATGDYAQALDIHEEYERGLALASKELGVELGKGPEALIHRMERGHLLLEVGRLAEARQTLDELLSDPRSPDLGELLSHALFHRGRVAEAEGNPAAAIDFYRGSVDKMEGIRSSIRSEAEKIGFVGDKQDVYSRLVRTLVAANRPGEAFEYVERAKARALVDMLASREMPTRSGATRESVNEFLPVLAELNAEVARFDPVNATAEQREKSQQTRGLIKKTAERLQQGDYELASLVTATTFSEASLRELLQPGETLVEYYYFGLDLYAFVATKDSLRVVRLDVVNLSDEVHAFRTAVQNPQSENVPALAQALHRRLIAPLDLPPKGPLLIVPHGVLHYLPFNALSSDNVSLIDRHTLRLLPSSSVMKFLNQRKPGGKGLIVFGNPDLGDAQYDLPGAQKEATEIARLHPNSTLLIRGEATKTAAKKLSGDFAYLHFASHGKFVPGNPLQSGIFLAKDKQTGNSGTLTVDELYSLNLNADLVTLSACETALGSISNGDDVVGLTRGFFYAGVSSIVSSLWQVDDDATYRTMTKFYSELNKLSKAEALRKAQLAVKATQPHPYYWAAFQLTGNRH